MAMSLDQEIDRLVSRFGFPDVLAALCRYCNRIGMPVIFRRLNRVYEYLTEHTPADRKQPTR